MADVNAFLDHIRAQLDGPMKAAGCLVWNTMQNPINGDPRIKTLTEQQMQRLRRGLTSALQRAADAGELPQAAPKYLAEALRAGVLEVSGTRTSRRHRRRDHAARRAAEIARSR